MAKNLVYKDARRLTLPVPADTVSGEPVVIGTLPGVALTDRDSAGNAAVDTGGAYTLSVEAVNDSGNSAVAVGDDLYYGALDDPKISKKVAGTYYGKALGTVTSGETASIAVRLGDGPTSAQAVIVVDDDTIENDESNGLQVKDDGITAAKLTDTANSRAIIVPLGAVSATTSQVVFVAPTAGTLNAAKIVTKDAVTADDTNYWTFALTDLGAAGEGTDKIVEMTTEETGGTGLAAYVALSLGTLNATHKVLAAGDVVLFTATKAASATALANAAIMLEFLPAEAA